MKHPMQPPLAATKPQKLKKSTQVKLKKLERKRVGDEKDSDHRRVKSKVGKHFYKDVDVKNKGKAKRAKRE
jgi:hypothetical protein